MALALQQNELELRQLELQQRAEALRGVPWTAPARSAHAPTEFTESPTDRGLVAEPQTAVASRVHPAEVPADAQAPFAPPAAGLFPGVQAYMPRPGVVDPQWELLHDVQVLLSHGVSPTHIAALLSQRGQFGPDASALAPPLHGEAGRSSCERIMDDLREAAAKSPRHDAGAPSQPPPPAAAAGGTQDIGGILKLLGRGDDVRQDGVPAAIAATDTVAARARALQKMQDKEEPEGCAEGEQEVQWRQLPVRSGTMHAAGARALHSEPRYRPGGTADARRVAVQ